MGGARARAMSLDFDATVTGAGVLGCSVADALANDGLDVCVVECGSARAPVIRKPTPPAGSTSAVRCSLVSRARQEATGPVVHQFAVADHDRAAHQGRDDLALNGAARIGSPAGL